MTGDPARDARDGSPVAVIAVIAVIAVSSRTASVSGADGGECSLDECGDLLGHLVAANRHAAEDLGAEVLEDELQLLEHVAGVDRIGAVDDALLAGEGRHLAEP